MPVRERDPRAAPGCACSSAVALAPIVRVFSRVMPRWLASAIVVIGIAAAFGLTAWTLSDEVSAFSQRLPSLVREVRATIQSASPRQSLMRQLQQAVTELEQTTTRAEADRRDAGDDRRDHRCPAVDVELRANRRLVPRGGDPADVPRLLSAGVGRDVQGQAREVERRAPVAEEGHRADDRRDRSRRSGASCSISSGAASSSAC